MLENVGIGCGMIVVTTVVHVLAMDLTMGWFKLTHARSWAHKTRGTRVVVVASFALSMFLASLIEAALWGATYLAVGALEHVEKAMYFSTVTYTTLGFGDVTLGERWRILSSLEAANGILMFGWTTALLATVVQRVYFPRRPQDNEGE